MDDLGINIPEPTREPKFAFEAVLLHPPYAHVRVRVQWDDLEEDFGAGSMEITLPIPQRAAQHVPSLREWALDTVRGALDLEKLRAARPPEP